MTNKLRATYRYLQTTTCKYSGSCTNPGQFNKMAREEIGRLALDTSPESWVKAARSLAYRLGNESMDENFERVVRHAPRKAFCAA